MVREGLKRRELHDAGLMTRFFNSYDAASTHLDCTGQPRT
jgi:hypothetical protein